MYSFYSVHNGSHTLFREYSYLHATAHNRKNFIRTVWSCFRNVAAHGSELLTVKEYHSLVTLVCRNFPVDVIQRTARIVLMDDAPDCLISFVDFLYALQLQLFYEEFIMRAKEAYAHLQDLSAIDQQRHNEGVDSSLYFEKLRLIYESNSHKFESRPSLRVVEQELRQKNNSASSGGGKVTTFYSFLMSLSKNEAVNGEIGVLPEREKVFEGKDIELFREKEHFK